MPLVSVVIPTFNAAAYLPAAIESVLGQSFRDFEVIVIDDGSTDNTADAVGRYGDRVTYVRQPASGGPSGPRNAGIELARGNWVSLLDSDDLMEPDRLAEFATFEAENPGVDLYFNNFRFINAHGEICNPDFHAGYPSFQRKLVESSVAGLSTISGPELVIELIRGNFIGTSSVIVRRDAITAVGGFDVSLRNSEDRAVWLALARSGSVFGYSSTLSHAYRVRDDNISSRGLQNYDAIFEVLEREKQYSSDPRLLREIDLRARSYLLEKAWDLGDSGATTEALDHYRKANAIGITWRGIKGILKTHASALRGFLTSGS